MSEHSRHIIQAVAGSIALLLAMWVTSLWVYDREKMDDALAQRQALIAGETPYQWRFDSPGELGIAHDPEQFRWSGGRLQGALDDPYFYVNLEGRRIDAWRYSVLELHLYSAEAEQLRLFHEQPGEAEIHASEFIDLAQGWQTIEVDLATAGWRSKDSTKAQPVYVDSSWGNEAGVVSALRIDPVRAGAFEIDHAKLKPPAGVSFELSDIEPFRTLDDPLFDRMRGDVHQIWLIAHDHWARTPETAQWVRRTLAGEFPAAVMFPRPPTERELARDTARARLAPGTVPGLLFVLALLALAGGRLAAPFWRPILETTALLLAIEAAVFWAPYLPASVRWLLTVPLAAVAWVWRPLSLGRTVLGDGRAWLWVAPLMAVALVLVLSHGGRTAGASLLVVLGLYLLWALLQQYVTAVLFRDRLAPALGALSSVLAAGAFGFLHFPNFALMTATFLLGLYLMEVYRRHRNLLAIASAHALLAVGVNLAAPYYLWLSRTIGPRFLALL